MQNAPIHQSHVYSRVKLSRTIFKKGHQRKIPVKLFQNLTIGFREEDFLKIFLRISSCPYSARSPHSPKPYFWTDQNFANNFWKVSTKEHSFEIILKSDQGFQRRRFYKNFLMSVNCKKSPSPWRPCFSTYQNFAINFWKGSHKEQSCETISNSEQRFQRRRILKNFFEVHTVKKASPHGGHVFRRTKISQTIFEKGHTRNNPVKLFRILSSGFGEDF